MSVFPHSSNESFFIFCVGTDLIRIAAFVSSMTNSNVRFKQLVGMYNGQAERSFIASMDDFRKVEPWLSEEESILHIHSYNARDVPKATLIFLKEGREEYLGRLVAVSREEALAQNNWTYDPLTKTYYITKMV